MATRKCTKSRLTSSSPWPTTTATARIDDTPEYVFSYHMEDAAGNKTTVNVPIRVLDVGVDIKDIESRSGRK